MPLYEYQCSDCGQLIEVIQKFSDEPLSTCADCGGRVERLLSASAIQFKGAGWYVNDYAKKNNGGGSPSSSSAPKESSTKKPETGDKASGKSTEKVN